MLHTRAPEAFEEGELDLKTPEGFRRIYEAYGSLVISVCLRYINNRAECEDLTAKLFASLWERRDSLEINGSIRGYLYQAAKLQVSEYFRLAKRREDRLQRAAEKLDLYNVVVENEVWYRDFLQHLEEAIEDLPPKRREAFRLVKLEGLSVKQVSQQMSLAETTVTTHLYKATTELKVKLSDYRSSSRSTGS
ncbi:MAG: sigma-70 family RNA polymerase sigma factor [Bacteroidota bacterium]